MRLSVRSMMFALIAVLLLASLSARGQEITRGFGPAVRATATGEELGNQPGLWILEVKFKPMRLINVQITDPKTGKKSNELVWYLCYKAVNRPLNRKTDASDVTPVNDDDPPPSKPVFIPEFTLVTDDGGVQKAYRDVVIPEAQAALLKREVRRPTDVRYKNSVEIVGPLPEPSEATDPPGQTLWGVATFRGVDPESDHFTVYLSGFSNGYRIGKGPDGKELVLRRTIRQEFWRPGDEFDQKEIEFRLKGDAAWEYRPDDVQLAAEPVDAKATDSTTAAPKAEEGAEAAPAVTPEAEKAE